MKKEPYSLKNDRENMISRKVALQKVGKYAAFTAASMMLLMSPAKGAPTQNSIAKPKRH
jgi:hypothetical protein